jgi:hypothetical protein
VDMNFRNSAVQELPVTRPNAGYTHYLPRGKSFKYLHFRAWHDNCTLPESYATRRNTLIDGGVMSYDLVAKDWRELSEAASQERDPKRLLDLVTRLNAVLKEREDKKRDISQGEPPNQ